MGRFVKGDIVVAPFPYSNLTMAKRRPALVVAALSGDDVLLCQITSQDVKDGDAIPLMKADCDTGGLSKRSNIRPNRLFTADSRIVAYRAGTLGATKMGQVTSKIIEIVTR